MAKLTFTGLDGYIAQLEKLRQSADGITKKALYEGAGVTADEIRSAVEALPTDNDRSAGHYLKGITDEQKAAVKRWKRLQRDWALRPSNRRGTGLIRLSALQAIAISKRRNIRRDSPLR